MSVILEFDFQTRKQLRFSEVNYLNYTKKDPILYVTTTFSLKQGETRTNCDFFALSPCYSRNIRQWP